MKTEEQLPGLPFLLFGPSATAIEDEQGKCKLYVSGINLETSTTVVFLYSEGINSWSVINDDPVARVGFSGLYTYKQNGKDTVLILGGVSEDYKTVSSGIYLVANDGIDQIGDIVVSKANSQTLQPDYFIDNQCIAHRSNEESKPVLYFLGKNNVVMFDTQLEGQQNAFKKDIGLGQNKFFEKDQLKQIP